MPSSYQRIPALLLLAAVAPWSQALDTNLSVSYAAEYTNNTLRSDSDEIGEWLHTPGVSLGLSQQGAALELDADYQLLRRIYQRDLFDDETVITGRTSLVWHALPDRLDLIARNTRTEATERAREPSVQTNRQTVSITDIGPVLRFRPRSNAELQLTYLYTDVSADETDTDNHRHTGELRYLVELSPIRSLEFSASNMRVQFENPAAPDLDVRLGEVGFEHRGREIEYRVAGGYNVTRRTMNRDTVRGPIADLSVRWRLAADTSLAVTARHAIVDNATDLTTGTISFGESVDENTDLNEVFTETHGSLELAHRLGNNDIVLRLTIGAEDYEDVPRDSERRAASLLLSRDLTPRTRLRAAIEVGRRKFTDEDDAYDELRGMAEISRQISRRFEIALGALYEKRDPDDVGGFAYDEWIGRLSLRYHLLGTP